MTRVIVAPDSFKESLASPGSGGRHCQGSLAGIAVTSGLAPVPRLADINYFM